LWCITRSVSKHNLQILLSTPFPHDPMRVHTCIGRSCPVRHLGSSLLTVATCRPFTHRPRYRCGRRPLDHLLSPPPKISLWSSPTRLSSQVRCRQPPTCATMDRENLGVPRPPPPHHDRSVGLSWRGLDLPDSLQHTAAHPLPELHSLPEFVLQWTQGTRSSLPMFRSLPSDVIVAGVASFTAIMDKYGQRYPGIKFISVDLASCSSVLWPPC
jgi:hypothetical protein